MASNFTPNSEHISLPVKKLFQTIQYNMHGLNQGTPLLNFLCQDIAPSIIFVSEHWQTPANINKILNFSDNYTGFGISAMHAAVQTSILRGRPWGGTAILIKNDFIAFTKPILLSERAVIISLNKFIFVNVYLPCLSLSSFEVIQGILDEIHGALEGLSYNHLIFGGDLNCNIHENSIVASAIRDFMQAHDLAFFDQGITAADRITYEHATLAHSSYIDFLFMSNNLIQNFVDYKILDSALNHSDHSAVSISFSYTDAELDIKNNSPNLQTKPSSIKYLRWDQAKLASYYEGTYRSLDPLRIKMQESYDHWATIATRCEPSIKAACRDAAMAYIEDCYTELTSRLHCMAEEFIPKLQTNSLKFWWSQLANDLKDKSIASHREWLNNNKPRSGPIYDAMKDDKYKYKLYLRKQKESNRDGVTEVLYDNLIQKDTKSFWKTFKSKVGNKRSHEKVIDGRIIEQDIAESFATTFSNICKPNTAEHFVKSFNLYNTRKVTYRGYYLKDLPLSVQLIDGIISNLKKGKAASLDKLTVEHLCYAHPCVIIILTNILNLMLIHEYVPDAFGQTVTFPVPKTSSNKLQTSSDDYRGITVSPIISKIFEHCLLQQYKKYLFSSNSQFGYKKSIGCNHAHYAVQKSIEYFISRDSTVNLCSLDLSKAFDKLNRYILFAKLMDRNCPIKFINILECWFNKSYTSVKWGNSYSRLVSLSNGIRQGSILSPFLFSVYTNDLLVKLQLSKLGCHINYINFNAFMYADDLLLLSLSLADLQKMLHICLGELQNLDMCVNVKKSCIIRIGKSYNSQVSDIYVGDTPIPWGKAMTYLGVCFMAGKDIRYDFHQTKAKFFGSLNSLLGKIGTVSQVALTLSLTTTMCYPILTYGLESLSLNKTQFSSLCYAHNAIFVKVFSTFDRKIIEQCQFYTGILPLQYKYDLMRINFLFTLSNNYVSPANIIFHLFGFHDLVSLCTQYAITYDASPASREHAVWQRYSDYISK
jgi:exonuclease III